MTTVTVVTDTNGDEARRRGLRQMRAVALGQVTRNHADKLIRKELLVALANGIIWGGVMGVISMMLYRDVKLGLVMVLAMTLNLLLAALMGVLIPMTMLRVGRDPAVGSSVLITAVTDSGGFFIFLGLATLFLL
jgi:magnesium transporter